MRTLDSAAREGEEVLRYNRRKGSRTAASSSTWRNSMGGAFIVDRQGTILGFDEGMEELTGWPAVDVVGRHKDRAGTMSLGVKGQERIGALYEGTIPIDKGTRNLELRLRCRDGSTVDVEALAALLPGRGERASVSVLRILVRSTEAMPPGELDGFDSRTGLCDGEAFARYLSTAFRSAAEQGRTLALLLADVDHLRRINDRLGHEAGNCVLEKLAGIFRANIDPNSEIARLGDDDFAILLTDAGRGEARQTAARLRSTVERFRFFEMPEGENVPVTLSLGAASFPADAEDEAGLMKRAGEALEEARQFGRNRVWCYTRRPRVPLEVPVYFDATEALLVGFTRDLSPSGVFVQTSAPVEMGMRCALAFPLPNHGGKIHVVGRVVRTVPPVTEMTSQPRVPGMGIEFEKFGSEDRRAIETYLHAHEFLTNRPEDGTFST